ncbi:MAG: PRD domain-containing protein [Lachnospiraceae bacterium]|nr:PRD domain-containing protein [Lachnospiraceae bacterium]
MRVIKKLNNNFAICVDGEGQELIAYGKGIGFPKVPYEITDLNVIDRTFYDIDSRYLALLNELPEKVFHFTVKLVDIARNELQYELNPNLVLTLADHISFCIERARKNIYVQMPLIYELEQSYPKEGKLGRYAVKQIERRFAIRLNPNEASGIAASFVNARYSSKSRMDVAMRWQMQFDEILEDTISIVEDEIGIVIDRDSFNFARYSSHLMYLLKRISSNQALDTDNGIMYQSLREEFQEIAECVDLIDKYFGEKWKFSLSDEEKLYLILHVNRICVREGL